MGQKSAIIMPKTQIILRNMGEQIRLSRLRRKIPVSLICERAGVSRNTVSSIEKGSPSVSMGNYAAVLHAIGGMDSDLLLIAKDDILGRRIQDSELPKRIRGKK